MTAVFWPKCECESNVLVIKVFKLLVEIKEIIRGFGQTLFKKHKQAFQLMLTISLVYLSGFYIHLNAVTIENFQTNIMLLTIRPVDRKGYGSIAHEAKPNGLLTVTLEGEGSNCFSITQLVGQKRQ